MMIRVATESDLLELGEIYSHSVTTIAPQLYSDKQVKIWASFPSDIEVFKKIILEPTTFVAVEGNEILGFAGISDKGHVASFYVRGDRCRQGIGTRLMSTVLAYAKTNKIYRLYSEASEFSRPLFEKMGFDIYGTEDVERNGVSFHRYLVQINC
jgi:putative acetyltransferase